VIVIDGIEYKEVMSWLPDRRKKSTRAVAAVSANGVAIRLPYTMWSKKNKCYSSYRLHIYKQGTNRGKNRLDPISWKGTYRYVDIRGKAYSVHRLVAQAWLPNDDGKPQVNHINGVRDDNRAANLEWVTNDENMSHAISKGLYVVLKGEDTAHHKLTEDQVMEFKLSIKDGIYRGQLAHFAKKFGVGITTMSEIKAARSWSHVTA